MAGTMTAARPRIVTAARTDWFWFGIALMGAAMIVRRKKDA